MSIEDHQVWTRAVGSFDQRIGWGDATCLAALPSPVRWLVAMMTIEGQIGNGGFHAVWYNRCDGFLLAAIEGYEAIGLPEFATLLRQALDMTTVDPYAGPHDIWPDRERAEAPVGSLDIGDLDEPWYALQRELIDRADRAKADLVRKYPEVFPQAP